MIAKAKAFLQEDLDKNPSQKLTIVQGSYADRDAVREQSGEEKVDFMLLDLGVNMDHFKVAER